MIFPEELVLPAFVGRPAGAPWVVALEGPNGAGKTTLCRLLAGRLQVPACLGIDEAWFGEPFKTRMIRDADWYASALFFLSGYCEQMRSLRARTERMVVMDRSLWSTLAVHAAAVPERLNTLVRVLGPLAPLIRCPDLTLVLEATFETCQTRIAYKSGTAKALDELTATPGFHSREKEFYRWLGRKLPKVTYVNVDRAEPDVVLEDAYRRVLASLPC